MELGGVSFLKSWHVLVAAPALSGQDETSPVLGTHATDKPVQAGFPCPPLWTKIIPEPKGMISVGISSHFGRLAEDVI